MSFVGTRPEAIKYVEKYSKEMFATFLLPAGITSEATDVSNWVLEIFIMNFEDGSLTEDEFVKLLNLFGKRPDDFGFDLIVDDSDLDELNELFESGDIDEG